MAITVEDDDFRVNCVVYVHSDCDSDAVYSYGYSDAEVDLKVAWSNDIKIFQNWSHYLELILHIHLRYWCTQLFIGAAYKE